MSRCSEPSCAARLRRADRSARRSPAADRGAEVRLRHSRRRRRRSPAGTSTCGPTARACPRAAAPSPQGQAIYDAKCASCHGTFGESNSYLQIAGGVGYARHPTSRCARPAASSTTRRRCGTTSTARCRSTRRKTLTPDEVYALTAYVLNLNDILPADAVLDRDSLPRVKMPNRDGFTTAHGFMRRDGKPDTRNVACMTRLRDRGPAVLARCPTTRATSTATSPSRARASACRAAAPSDAPRAKSGLRARRKRFGVHRLPRRRPSGSSAGASATSPRRYAGDAAAPRRGWSRRSRRAARALGHRARCRAQPQVQGRRRAGARAMDSRAARSRRHAGDQRRAMSTRQTV